MARRDDDNGSMSDLARARKIAALQRLVDEAEASGVSSSSMSDIRDAARRKAGVDLGA